MGRMKRAFWPLVVPLALTLGGCESAYLLKQGYGQASLFFQRESLVEAERDPRLTDEQKARLAVVRAAKHYAIETLGLKSTESYDQVIVLERDAVTYVVSGAPKDALEPYLWHFPLVGAVPYKGFFDRKDAVAEKEALEARGLDAHVRGVAAFSLLGILPDPLYSSLLKYGASTLSNIILHELTHGTVYLQGESSFNEGFATFVGNQGALGFLAARYGADSPELAEAKGQLHDERLYVAFLNDLAARLRALYAAPVSREAKLERREAAFAEARAQFALIPFKTDVYKGFHKVKLNNAYLMTLLTYQSNATRFEKVYHRLGQDLPAFIRFFRDEVAKAPNPEAFLDRWLSSESR